MGGVGGVPEASIFELDEGDYIFRNCSHPSAEHLLERPVLLEEELQGRAYVAVLFVCL